MNSNDFETSESSQNQLEGSMNSNNLLRKDSSSILNSLSSYNEMSSNQIGDHHATVKALESLLEEELQKSSMSINLSERGLSEIPPKLCSVLSLERLGLNNNMLSWLPLEFSNLSNLRYLNLKNNQFKEIPQCLCDLPALEILDLSRNKIKELPKDPGYLLGLRVWSLSRNKITHIPSYIGKMKELVLFKIERNPIQWPPDEIMRFSDENLENLADVELAEKWLKKLQTYLKEHDSAPTLPSLVSTQKTQSAPSQSLNIFDYIQSFLNLPYSNDMACNDSLFKACQMSLSAADTFLRSGHSHSSNLIDQLTSSCFSLINCIDSSSAHSKIKYALQKMLSDLKQCIQFTDNKDSRFCRFQILIFYGISLDILHASESLHTYEKESPKTIQFSNSSSAKRKGFLANFTNTDSINDSESELLEAVGQLINALRQFSPAISHLEDFEARLDLMKHRALRNNHSLDKLKDDLIQLSYDLKTRELSPDILTYLQTALQIAINLKIST